MIWYLNITQFYPKQENFKEEKNLYLYFLLFSCSHKKSEVQENKKFKVEVLELKKQKVPLVINIVSFASSDNIASLTHKIDRYLKMI